VALLTCPAQSSAEPKLQTAAQTGMQYYVSLPSGWTAGRKWPVVVAIEGGRKDFKAMAQRYADARKGLPFIIVTPFVLTNGGGDLRHLPNYSYPPAVWEEVDRDGPCSFDLNGLIAVIADVQRKYSGEDKVFMTGLSAGGHLTWAMIFQHPEKLRAAALAAGNYNGRCMRDGQFSTAGDRHGLPIKGFGGETDEHRAGVENSLEDQFHAAATLAKQHGYSNISYEVIPGRGHEAFPDKVLEFFMALRDREGRVAQASCFCFCLSRSE
jgi:poly(3-hydroxybutyrate) depolymerase